MLVNKHEVSYEQQSLSKDRFFITDLCIDLPVDEGIKEFDSKYFNHLLIKMIVEDLSTLSPEGGLSILQQLPPLSEKNFCNLLLRLPLVKIKHILMNDEFYSYLWRTCYSFSIKE